MAQQTASPPRRERDDHVNQLEGLWNGLYSYPEAIVIMILFMAAGFAAHIQPPAGRAVLIRHGCGSQTGAETSRNQTLRLGMNGLFRLGLNYLGPLP